MHQNQYGLSLGGPIAKDRTFFFANVEQRDLDQSGLTTITDANVAAINTRLAATGYPGSPVATGVYPNPVHTTLGLAKLDHHAGSHQLSLRYSLYRVDADNSRGAGALAAPSASAGLDNVDHAVSFSDSWVLSGRTVNETRVLYAHGDLQAPPSDPVGPAVSISGVASFGTASGSPTRRTNTLVEVVDTLSHQAGAHALRAGVDFLYNDTTITYPRSVRGSYAFSSMANFQLGLYNNAGFTQTFGDPVVAQTNPNLGLFVQDEWHACFEPDAERRAALRPAVPRDDRHRHEQRLAAPRLRVDAVGLAAHRDPRQRRALLRPRAAAGARQRDPLRRQHDRPLAAAADERQPLARPGRGAPLPEHPDGGDRVGDAPEPHHHGPADAERELAPGLDRDRAPARVRDHRERRLLVPARQET